MRTIEDQLRAYTDQIDTAQRPVTIDEALALVDAVRVQDSGTRLPPTRSRKQGILIAASIAAAVLLLLGSTFFLRARVDDTEVGTASTTVPTTVAPSPITTVAPEPTQSIETPMGTWVWQKIEPPLTGRVVEFDGVFYSVDGYREFDREGQPTPLEERNPDNWLLTSSDGVTWERTLLPDEMRDHTVFLRPTDDDLIIFGMSEIGLPPTCWRSIDGATWTPSECPMAGTQGLDLMLPDIEVEGVQARVQTFNDPVLAGTTRLVLGNLYFEFPDFVNEILRSGYSSGPEGDDSGAYQVIDDDTGSITHEIDYVIEGTSIEYTFWDGRSNRGTVIHTARIDMGSAELMNQIDRSGSLLGPSLNLLWRSPSAGGPFEVVDDPFVSDAGPLFNRHNGIQHLTSINGSFVAYGAVIGGSTTRVNEFVTRNEPSSIGAIAVSADGLTWRITEIPELVNPWRVQTLDDGRVLWNGEFGYWISDDGLTGELMPLDDESDGIESAFGMLVSFTDGGLRISEDGRQWSRIPLPERVSNGATDFGILFDRAWYNVTPDGGETTSWVGYFEP